MDESTAKDTTNIVPIMTVFVIISRLLITQLVFRGYRIGHHNMHIVAHFEILLVISWIWLCSWHDVHEQQ